MSAAASSSSKYILYTYWRSSASWRVRIALAYKNIPYTQHPINLLKSEQTSDDYVKLNPQRKVPLLVIDEKQNKTIAQSLAIMDYLDHAHPETPTLFPKDPYLRAKAWMLAEGVNADIQPLHNLAVLGKLGSLMGESASKEVKEEKRQEWGKWAVENGLKAFETNLKDLAGKYCMGESITIADVCLVPQMSAARRFNVDLTQYPTLLRIEKELSTHPAFIAGHANAQADKPADIGTIL